MTSCACGCGELAPPRGGTYRPGHHWRVKPRKLYPHTATGLTLHRQRAAAALGRPLPASAEVHHPDEDKTNRGARLVICQDKAYHMLLHARMRVREAGGNPNTDKVCACCRQPKPFADYSPANGQYQNVAGYCRPCTAAKQSVRSQRKKSAA